MHNGKVAQFTLFFSYSCNNKKESRFNISHFAKSLFFIFEGGVNALPCFANICAVMQDASIVSRGFATIASTCLRCNFSSALCSSLSGASSANAIIRWSSRALFAASPTMSSVGTKSSVLPSPRRILSLCWPPLGVKSETAAAMISTSWVGHSSWTFARRSRVEEKGIVRRRGCAVGLTQFGPSNSVTLYDCTAPAKANSVPNWPDDLLPRCRTQSMGSVVAPAVISIRIGFMTFIE